MLCHRLIGIMQHLQYLFGHDAIALQILQPLFDSSVVESASLQLPNVQNTCVSRYTAATRSLTFSHPFFTCN